jgi:putative membrane protein
MFQRILCTFTSLAAALFLLCFVGWTQTSGSSNSSAGSKLSSSDKQFLTKAAEGGKAEVELGQLAAQKGNSKDVKDFGQRMVNDHQKANDQLEQVAQKEGLNLPDRMDPESQRLKSRLEKLSGADFDKAYMSAMVKDHTKDVKEFKDEASKGKDPEVKNFAQQTVATLEQHLNMAKQIESKEKR